MCESLFCLRTFLVCWFVWGVTVCSALLCWLFSLSAQAAVLSLFPKSIPLSLTMIGFALMTLLWNIKEHNLMFFYSRGSQPTCMWMCACKFALCIFSMLVCVIEDVGREKNLFRTFWDLILSCFKCRYSKEGWVVFKLIWLFECSQLPDAPDDHLPSSFMCTHAVYLCIPS